MLVKEAISFKQYRNPKEALDVSIKPLIEEWLEKHKITQFCTINDDLSIDSNTFIGIMDKIEESELPYFIKFNKTLGFSCSKNNLTSLRGCPKIVEGNFYCYANKLTSLEGAPKEVSKNFVCHNNPGNFTEEDVKAVCNVISGKIEITGKI